MNIIGNSCIASFLTKNYLHEQFNNPFCWCILDFNSIYNLIQNYNDINFLNIDFIHRADNTFSIVVDNLVTIRYPHYILDFTAKNILYDGPNIRYYRIYEYIYMKNILTV